MTTRALFWPSADAPDTDDDRAPVLVREDALIARTKAARDALAPRAVSRPNLDVARAAETVRACAPDLDALLPRMAALPDVDVAQIARLGELAEVLACLEDRVRRARRSGTEVQRRAALGEAWALFGKLKKVAGALVGLEVITRRQLDALKLGRTRRDLPDALGRLRALFQRVWRKVDGRTPVTETDLARAFHLASTLPGLETVEDPSDRALRALVEERDRAYTLLLRAWDEARRAVIFLRWREKDADRFAPSLFAGRVDAAKAKAKRVKKTAASAEGQPAAPAADAASAQGQPAAPAGHAATAEGQPAAPAGHAASERGQPAAPRRRGARSTAAGGPSHHGARPIATATTAEERALPPPCRSYAARPRSRAREAR